jgi:hypothetical protein
MQSNALFTCEIGTTDPSATVGIEVWIDDQQIFSSDHVQETTKIQHNFNDDDGDHELRFVMKNKNEDHTKVDENGNFTKDARLVVSNVAFEEIPLNQLFFDQAVYHHDFNGTQDPIDDKFFGEMGCNGVLSLKFTTPIYLWLLEHM